MSSAKKQLEDIFNKSPIGKEVPEDVWGTIYPTWTGLWTDYHGEFDEKQPCDIYPLSELLSTEAYDRLVKELLAWAKK